MRIKCVVAAAVCAVMMLAVGCASEYPPITAEEMIEESFHAWMAKNDPAAERKENGIYLRFVERGAIPITPKADESWLKVNYTLYGLDGIMGETRDEAQSKLISMFKPTTHFVDDMIPYYSQKSAAYPWICEGLRSAFQYLRQGDSVRIYIPMKLGYFSSMGANGMNINAGYLGESGGYVDRPCYFDLRVNEVIDNPEMRNLQMVQRYVTESWGISAADSVIRGVYMRVLKDDPKGSVITADSTVRYYYATRFLDHHLILSNVTAVIEKAKYLYFKSPAVSWSTYPISFSEFTSEVSTSSDTTERKVLAAVLLKAKTGQTIEWVSASEQFTFGPTGQLKATPQILPYEARRMQMRLLRWDEKEDQKLYDWSLLY